MNIDEFLPLVRITSKGIFLSCHVLPNASKTEIKGVFGKTLKISLAAPPVDGKANKELCNFFSKKCHLPKSFIEITSGLSSKNKIILIQNIELNKLFHYLVES